jgi:hypothetical protein
MYLCHTMFTAITTVPGKVEIVSSWQGFALCGLFKQLHTSSEGFALMLHQRHNQLPVSTHACKSLAIASVRLAAISLREQLYCLRDFPSAPKPLTCGHKSVAGLLMHPVRTMYLLVA